MPIDDMGPERTARLSRRRSTPSARVHRQRLRHRLAVPGDHQYRGIPAADPPARSETDGRFRLGGADPPAGRSALRRPDAGSGNQRTRAAAGCRRCRADDGDGYARWRRPVRFRFHQLFGFDPSTGPGRIDGHDSTGPVHDEFGRREQPDPGRRARLRLHQILDKYKNDDDALIELFILVHAREPSAKGTQTCRDYIREVNNRQEAFEDILWSLLNSTEFQSKR